ncbi:MAG: peptidylprolyl isomerase [Bacteroidales bacterium]|nr:peptidylprolyl isomerase [Bacteroidales bacterium]
MHTYQKNNDLKSSSEQDLRDYLDLFIVYKLKVKEGKEMLIDTSASFQRELAGYRNQSAQQYLIDKDVTDFLINEAFERAKLQIRASHLLINCAYSASPKDTLAAYNKIMRIRNEILAGKDFATAAVQYSEDPSTQDRIDPQSKSMQHGNKGELGYFTALSLIYPFECGAYTTPVGQVSMPIRSQFGYHLIYVKDRVPAISKIVVSQIFLADSNALNSKIMPGIQAKLDTINNALKTNDFEEIVALYSNDRASAEQGGRLQPFNPEQRFGDFVTAAIHIKPGEISKPVASNLGWHILRLDTLEYAQISEDEKYVLKNRIARDSRSYKSRSSLVEKLKKEYNYEEKGKNAAFKFFNKNLNVNYFQSTNNKIEELAGLDKLKPLCTFADQKLTAQGLAKFIARYQGVQVNDFEAFLKEKFASFVEEEIFKYENSRLEQKYPEFKDLVTEFHDGLMLYEMNSNEVWNKAVQDTVGLENYYEKIKTGYPVDMVASPEDLPYKPMSEIKATVVSEYQDFLEKEWIVRLKAKYPVTIDEKVFSTLLKQ